MHSSAAGAAALMSRRSFSRAARCASFRRARYSSTVLGLAGIILGPISIIGLFQNSKGEFEGGGGFVVGLPRTFVDEAKGRAAGAFGAKEESSNAPGAETHLGADEKGVTFGHEKNFVDPV